MVLSEEQKKKIEEEEAYRAEVRVNPKKKKGIGCFGLIGILFVLGILYSVFIFVVNPSGRIERAKQLQSQTANNQYVFNVPSLVGKDLDGVIAVLGQPQGQDPTALQIQQGVREWDKTFIKDGKELLVTYSISNRKIVDFFISTDDSSGNTTDTGYLLQISNLQENDPRYRVEFVKSIKNPSSFTGVKVIPN